MNFDLIIDRFRGLNFRQAVWLFPCAYALHVLEELPQFTVWAQHYAAASFSMNDYLVIHLSGLAVAIMVSAVIWSFPIRGVIFIFLHSFLRRQFASISFFMPGQQQCSESTAQVC